MPSPEPRRAKISDDPHAIVALTVALDRIRPPVIRRIEVPVAITLHDLHRVIQTVMPWGKHHLYEFQAGASRWRQPDEDWPIRARDRDATVATLAEMLDGSARRFTYVYDLGDYWQHTIRVTHVDGPAAGVGDLTRAGQARAQR